MSVMDIYCGIGTISLCAARQAKRVIGVEIVERAIEDAKENASRNGIENTEFYADSAENIVPKLIAQGETPDVIILDPPRKGSDEKTLTAIVKAQPERIVYVSCNPATLARDARFLSDRGYAVTKVKGFDLFPHTAHVECVVLMSRVVNNSSAKEITVHSSIYAKDIYSKLGFIQNGDLCNDECIQYIPMVYKNLIQKLQDKDDKKAYELAKQIAAVSAASDEYYSCFDDFLSMINAESSYVRTRGFSLCCAQARWDTEGKLEKALPSIFALLHDKKPTVVRQCLAALHEVVLYRPELCEIINEEIKKIDLTGYKDSMAPLIQKDIDELTKMIN